ncbi:hypothetical protein KIPB_004889 [Kipferlia bialata]|uniref:Carboxypeptidase regulatory-like domain-containing protein n=1 Tax=Kipferlia bialata TaxID=797122 RepID=A0A9K3GIL4_9EUKA|nr:hypothetical protein KIPB_004889 [Kipferlia bialata]|eukprot:g4889.t1
MILIGALLLGLGVLIGVRACPASVIIEGCGTYFPAIPLDAPTVLPSDDYETTQSMLPYPQFAIKCLSSIFIDGCGQVLAGVLATVYPASSFAPIGDTLSANDGTYSIDLTSYAGDYSNLRIEFSKEGFISKEETISVPDCGVVEVNISMVPEAVDKPLLLSFLCILTGEEMGPGCFVTACEPSLTSLPVIECGDPIAEGWTNDYGEILFLLPATTGPVVYVTIESCSPFTFDGTGVGTLIDLDPVSTTSETISIECGTMELHGCVKNNPRSRPLVGAEVCVACPYDPQVLCTETDSTGGYSLDIPRECAVRGDTIEVTAYDNRNRTYTAIVQTDPTLAENEQCFYMAPGQAPGRHSSRASTVGSGRGSKGRKNEE